MKKIQILLLSVILSAPLFASAAEKHDKCYPVSLMKVLIRNEYKQHKGATLEQVEMVERLGCPEGSSSMYYSNGVTAGSKGYTWYYPNGQTAGSVGYTWYYPNGQTAGSDGYTWYHANGSTAGSEGYSWYYANGEYAGTLKFDSLEDILRFTGDLK